MPVTLFKYFFYISIAADQIGTPYLQSVVSQPKTFKEAFCMIPIMLSAVICYNIAFFADLLSTVFALSIY